MKLKFCGDSRDSYFKFSLARGCHDPQNICNDSSSLHPTRHQRVPTAPLHRRCHFHFHLWTRIPSISFKWVMADTDSDADFDFDSPLSSSIHHSRKQSFSHSPSHPRSSDRLYSIASSHRHVLPESEHSLLLNNRDAIRSYLSMTPLQTSQQYDSGGGSQRPLGILTRKISRVFQSKAYDYDSNKPSLAAVGSGERVW